jgi:hypothetical protein
MGRATDEKDEAVTSKTASRINRFIIRHLANNLHDRFAHLDLSRFLFLGYIWPFFSSLQSSFGTPWFRLALFFGSVIFLFSSLSGLVPNGGFAWFTNKVAGSHRHGTTLIFTLAFLFSLISRVTGFLPTLSIPQMIGSTLSVQLRGIRSAPIPRHFLLSRPSLNLFPSITIHFQVIAGNERFDWRCAGSKGKERGRRGECGKGAICEEERGSFSSRFVFICLTQSGYRQMYRNCLDRSFALSW